MILYRSATMFHCYGLSSTPKLLSQVNCSFSLLNGSPPSPLVCLRFLCLGDSNRRGIRGFAASSAAASSSDDAEERKGGDTFLAGDSVSWKSLGLSDRLSRALCIAGFDRPSLTQAACIPAILSGKDVVIAAETGSGKTHGYLAPVFDRLCHASLDSTATEAEQRLNSLNKVFLILCPNILLCEQVVRMANGLLNYDGKPLLRVEAVCGGQGWPVKQPDIVVSTPAAFLNNIHPRRQQRLDFIRCVKFVVFDEADMLLCGSFENQVIRLINMLRFDEKQLSRWNKSGVENPTELDHASMSQVNLDNVLDESSSEQEEISGDLDDSSGDTGTGSRARKDWKRVRYAYERSKQYIFVAATLPVNGKKTAGSVLKRMFPDASWASGNFLHRHSPRLEYRWIEVSVDTQLDALVEAVNQGLRFNGVDDNAEMIRTMVFANTVEAVEAVASILQRAGIECHCYHKNHSLEERSKILANFREQGGMLVCTDAVARGVDIPNVSHVVQADFATSAVDFLHRIGRTGRAGRYGLVTNLYTEANQDLVDAIQRAETLGKPVETAFSRKRSFRNKLKKRGSPRSRKTTSVEFAEA